MEIKVLVLWKLLKEEHKQCIDIFTSRHSVRNRVIPITVADIDWLIQENDGRIVIPRIRIVNRLFALLVDGCRS